MIHMKIINYQIYEQANTFYEKIVGDTQVYRKIVLEENIRNKNDQDCEHTTILVKKYHIVHFW